MRGIRRSCSAIAYCPERRNRACAPARIESFLRWKAGLALSSIPALGRREQSRVPQSRSMIGTALNYPRDSRRNFSVLGPSICRLTISIRRDAAAKMQQAAVYRDSDDGNCMIQIDHGRKYTAHKWPGLYSSRGQSRSHGRHPAGSPPLVDADDVEPGAATDHLPGCARLTADDDDMDVLGSEHANELVGRSL